MILTIDSSRGIYVGKRIAYLYDYALRQLGWGTRDIDILRDPDHEHYCELWDSAVQELGQVGLIFVSEDGDVFEVEEGEEYCDSCEIYHVPGVPVDPSVCLYHVDK